MFNTVTGYYKPNIAMLELALRSLVSRRGAFYTKAYNSGYDFNDSEGFFNSLKLVTIEPTGLLPQKVTETTFLAMVYTAMGEGVKYSKKELGIIRLYVVWLDLNRRIDVLKYHMDEDSLDSKKYEVDTKPYSNGYFMQGNMSEDFLSNLLCRKIVRYPMQGVLYDVLLEDTGLKGKLKDKNKGVILPIGVRHEREVMDYLVSVGAVWGGLSDELYQGIRDLGYLSINSYLVDKGVVSRLQQGFKKKALEQEEKLGMRLVGINCFDAYYDAGELKELEFCIGTGAFSDEDPVCINEVDPPELKEERKRGVSIYTTPSRGVILWQERYRDVSKEDKVDISNQLEERRYSVTEIKDILKSSTWKDSRGLTRNYSEGNVVLPYGLVPGVLMKDRSLGRIKYLGGHQDNVYGFGGSPEYRLDKELLFLTGIQGFSGKVVKSNNAFGHFTIDVFNSKCDFPQEVSVEDAGDFLEDRTWCSWLLGKLTKEKRAKLDKFSMDSLEGALWKAIQDYVNDGYGTYKVGIFTKIQDYNKAVAKVFGVIADREEALVCQE